MTGGEGGQTILVSTTKGKYWIWDDNMYVYHVGPPRIIPEGIIDFVLTSTGTYGYESAGAGYLTVPSGFIMKVRVRG